MSGTTAGCRHPRRRRNQLGSAAATTSRNEPCQVAFESVTLVLAAVHPESIYLAADFRLSVKRAGRFEALDQPSMKIVRFEYPACHGLIAYTGFGTGLDGRSTAEHVTDWLVGVRNVNLDDLLDAIRSRADDWIARIKRRVDFPPFHTFVVAGYAMREPTLALISNFENLNSRDKSEPDSVFAASSRTASNGTIVRVAGQRHVVPRERSTLLRRTVDINALDSAHIRHAMLRTIERAANHPAARGTISGECAAVSIAPEGHGTLQLTEPTRVDVRIVFNGTPLPALGDFPELAQLERRGLVSVGFAGDGPPRYDNSRCKRSQYAGDPPSLYELHEVAIPGPPPHQLHSIDETGLVLASSQGSGPWPDFWLCRPGQGPELVDLGDTPRTGNGLLGPAGALYVTFGGMDSPQTTCLWEHGIAIPLAGIDNLPRTAHFGSPSGWLAGSVEVLADPTRSDRQRPARWTPSGELQLLELPTGVAGVATAITSDGTALVQLHQGLSDLHSHLWRTDGSTRSLISPVDGLAIGIDDAKQLTGRRLEGYAPIAIRTDALGDWEDLGTPRGWMPTRVANSGVVMGVTEVDGFNRPWVMIEGHALRLPGYYRHQCSIESAMAGVFIGTASSDHCSHALVWRTP